MISLLKFEYAGALSYIATNVGDQKFSPGELAELNHLASRIAQKTEKIMTRNKRGKQTR